MNLDPNDFHMHEYGGDLPLTPAISDPQSLSPFAPSFQLYCANRALDPDDLQQEQQFTSPRGDGVFRQVPVSGRGDASNNVTPPGWQCSPLEASNLTSRSTHAQDLPKNFYSHLDANTQLARLCTRGSSEADELSEPQSPKDEVSERRKERRRAQNRAAQRAFRARKEDTIKESSTRLESLQDELCRIQSSNKELQSQKINIQSTNATLQTTNTTLQATNSKLQHLLTDQYCDITSLETRNRGLKNRMEMMEKLIPGNASSCATARNHNVIAPSPMQNTRPTLSVSHAGGPRQPDDMSMYNNHIIQARPQSKGGDDVRAFPRETNECDAFANLYLESNLSGGYGWPANDLGGGQLEQASEGSTRAADPGPESQANSPHGYATLARERYRKRHR